FTYTETANGGMNNGAVEVTVPANWSAPSTTSSAKGYTTSSTGTVGVAGQLITITGVTLAKNATLTVTYGDTSGGGAGADAPTAAQSGTGTWSTRQKSSAAGGLTALGASPTVAVNNAADGSGTNTVSPTSVFAGSGGNSEVFTYTETANGGMNNGAVEVTVPANWSAPSTTSSAKGYTTSSTGTVGVAGQLITITGVTLAKNAT